MLLQRLVTSSCRLLVNRRRLFGVSPSIRMFSSNSTTAVESTSTATSAKDEVPIHLRPYNKEKYEVPSTKIKYSTGYALLDVEPMPRAKIMKISYNILNKLKDIPEEAMYRIYTEEKVKYIMKLTDEIDDIRSLEEEFGHDSIEMFIFSYAKEIELVDYMKHSKPWESRPEDPEQHELIRIASQKRTYLKHERVDRPQRIQQTFIGSGSSTATAEKPKLTQ